jgi:hypothetical protein
MNGSPEQVSERIFDSLDECKEFVETIANNPVVNSDYSFRFMAIDGIVFEGQCVSKEDFELRKILNL